MKQRRKEDCSGGSEELYRIKQRRKEIYGNSAEEEYRMNRREQEEKKIMVIALRRCTE